MSLRPHLWMIMEYARGDAGVLRYLVERATSEQLIVLYQRFCIAVSELRIAPGFASHAERNADWELASWVVSAGRALYHEAMRDPLRLPTRPPAGAPDYARIMEDVYRVRFGHDIPDQEPAPDADLRYDPEWEPRLWELVDVINVGVPFAQAVSGYTRSELVQLHAATGAIAERLLPSEVMFGDDPAGLAWTEWTHWAIGQGKLVIEHWLAHPHEAPRHVPQDFKALFVQLEDVYFERYGAQLRPIPPGRMGVILNRFLEQAVLRIVRDGRGRASWHTVATRLPGFGVPLAPDAMTVLGALQARGLVTRVFRGEGMDAWTITPAGEATLVAH